MGSNVDWRGMPREVVERVSRRRALRWRRPPEIRLTAAPGQAATVYYLCPDYPQPSGGIRAIYRHVDILNESGISAAVLHHGDGYSCTWFEHSTRVVGAPSVRLAPRDTLVVPEIYGPFLDRLPRQRRLVVFSQNAYLTFDHLPAKSRLSYDHFDAAITISADSAEYLGFAFPGLEAAVVPNGIDSQLFLPAEGMPSRRLALMPRKRPEEAREVLRLLGDRLRGWEVVTIEGASERETAELLRSAPVFIALGSREGFGLPAAEAMASGCYVAGFPAFGGREVFGEGFSSAVEDGDVLSLARAVDAALRLYERDPAAVRQSGRRARAHVIEKFSPAAQREALLRFFTASE